MACTTILVGKKASYDGSTMIARNDDSGSGHFTPKKFVVVHPDEQPKTYKSVISHVTIELPDDPMRYTAMPNAVEGEGIWAAAGVNEANVAMTATETITSNPRVLGADPLVKLQPAEDGKEEVPGGIGEEDIVCIVLPYIRSAREGVKRLGSLLEQYGTYEMNGIAFQDQDEIWWLETIGGHHWIARRVPDDVYVVMPNQLGIDHFDLEDALSDQKEYMCSSDLKEFIEKNHLNLSMDGSLNPRDAFRPCIQYAESVVYGALLKSAHESLGWRTCRLYPAVRRHSVVYGTGKEDHGGGCKICAVLPLPGDAVRSVCGIRGEKYARCIPLDRNQPQ